MSIKTSKDIRSTRLDKTFPFGREAILLIVKEVESGLNRKEACAKYGMAYATLSEWMRQYGSVTYHSTKKFILSAQQKRSIVRAVNEDRMTKEEACHSHGIHKRLLRNKKG
jgi:transposase-like protein